jgi:hypothetical protein
MGNVLLAGIFGSGNHNAVQRSESGQKMVRVLWRTIRNYAFFSRFFSRKIRKELGNLDSPVDCRVKCAR